jgi:REP element-mobilizing transposase RayT
MQRLAKAMTQDASRHVDCVAGSLTEELMARPLRLEFSGAVFHVMARGNARQQVFLDDDDYSLFLALLWRIADRVEWSVWAYCLMPNHYHLLVQTCRPTLSRGMRDLNGAYALKFNRRHERVGHVFQGRFLSIVVDTPAYLLELSRYIVLNPIRSGLTDRPEAWRWSSYPAMIGATRRHPKLLVRPTLAPFAHARDDGRAGFADYVRLGFGLPDPTTKRRVPTIAGDQPFVSRVLEPVEPSTEVPRVERARLPLSEFADLADRKEAIREAYRSGYYSQQDIARHFGLHYSTVSRIIGNCGFHDVKSKDLTP